MKIPIIINNRDLLTWPKAMVEKCKTYDNVGDIIIVDNGSSYPPLLEWYKTNPCQIVRCQNLGHQAPWLSGTVERLNAPYYVVTDSDLGIDDTPADTLNVLLKKLQNNPELHKVGLGLDWRNISSASPYFGHMITYERPRWQYSKIVDGIYTGVAIDTTFALYNYPNYFIGGGSLPEPYIAEHFPWYYSRVERDADYEFSYYLRHANHSASYLKHTGMKFEKLTELQASNPELYNTDKFGKSDNFVTHAYGDFYDELFFNRKDEALTVLEVGTYKGGFLRLISDYLKIGYITGIDNNPLWIPSGNSNIGVIIADAYKSKIIADFDIVIDDGPHTIESQIYALNNFPQYLKPGGILVIEDVPKQNLKKILESAIRKVEVLDWSDITGLNDDIIITYRNE